MDNLDKAWDKKEDINYLSDFLFGLLNVARDIPKEFAKKTIGESQLMFLLLYS
jgi:hypothetical protein